MSVEKRFKFLTRIFKALKELGREYSGLTPHDHIKGFLLAVGRPVYRFRYQCVINIRDRFALGRYRYIVTLKVVGISPSVVPLMMVTAYLVAYPCVILIPDTGNGIDYVASPDRVALNKIKLVI